MSGSQKSGGGSDDDLLWITVSIVGGIFLLWFLAHDQIAAVVLFLTYWQIKIVSMIPILGAGHGWTTMLMAIKKVPASKLTYSGVFTLLNYSGSIWRWPFLVACGVFAFIVNQNSVKRVYRTKMDFEKLLQIQSKNFPVILPAVRSRLSDKQRETGPWRRHITAYEYALEHQCLVPPLNHNQNEPYDYQALLAFLKEKKTPEVHHLPRINIRKLRRAIISEMTPWQGIQRLSPPRKAMAAAMALWINGDYIDDRYATSGGNRLFASYNNSFEAFTLKGSWHWRKLSELHPFFEKKLMKSGKIKEVESIRIDFSAAEEALKDPAIINTIEKFAGRHAYELTVLLAMLEECRNVMILPTQNFLWLKPIDRVAFYTLDSLGRPGAWMEGSGNVSHYRTELFNDKKIGRPQVDLALRAAYDEMVKHNWCSEDPT